MSYSDGWKEHDGLVDLGYKQHDRVNHQASEFARGSYHISGAEGFGDYAKHLLMKFRGMDKSKFYLHLKETEFRFNNRRKNLYKILYAF